MRKDFEIACCIFSVFIMVIFYITSMSLDEAYKQRKAIEASVESYKTEIKELKAELAENEKHMDNLVRCVITGEWDKDPRE